MFADLCGGREGLAGPGTSSGLDRHTGRRPELYAQARDYAADPGYGSWGSRDVSFAGSSGDVIPPLEPLEGAGSGAGAAEGGMPLALWRIAREDGTARRAGLAESLEEGADRCSESPAT